MHETEVIIREGVVWKVRVWPNGNLDIVDEQGRQRHASKGHSMTGVHLAMCLAERRFDSVDNLDVALRMAAERFEKEGGTDG